MPTFSIVLNLTYNHNILLYVLRLWAMDMCFTKKIPMIMYFLKQMITNSFRFESQRIENNFKYQFINKHHTM